MSSGKRASAEPIIVEESTQVPDVSGGLDENDGEDRTAIGDWSLALEEAKLAKKSIQATTKANAFDLEAAIARARVRDSIVDAGAAVTSSPPSGTRRRVSDPVVEVPVDFEDTAKPTGEAAPVAVASSPLTTTAASRAAGFKKHENAWRQRLTRRASTRMSIVAVVIGLVLGVAVVAIIALVMRH